MAKKRVKREQTLGRELWDGRRIKEIRDERKLSQEALAEMTGVSKGDISRHERNDMLSNPSIATLLRIALALKVPAPKLLEPCGSPIPRLEGDTGREERPEKGSAVLEAALLGKLDIDAPAEDTIVGDIHRAQHALASAQVALNRALRRADEESGPAASSRSPAATRR